MDKKDYRKAILTLQKVRILGATLHSPDGSPCIFRPVMAANQ